MQRRALRAGLLSALTAVAAAVSGCASTPGTSGAAVEDTNNDPYEAVNRRMWDLDMTLDRFLMKPLAEGYRYVTPQFVQTGITNALNNLKSPTILVNDVLQGNMDRAGQTFARISLNTVLGFGGLLDVGAKNNIPFHEADFGQTLGSWGVASGPYIVLPFLGPSDPRDAVGYGVDSALDPFSIEMKAHGIDTANYVRLGVELVNDRAQTIDELDELRRSSLDFYAAVRSLYQQQRAAAVETAKGGGNAPSPALVVPSVNEPSGPTPTNPPAGSSDSGKAK